MLLVVWSCRMSVRRLLSVSLFVISACSAPAFAAQPKAAAPNRADSLKKVEQLRHDRSYFVAGPLVDKLLAGYPGDVSVLMAAARLHCDMGLAARAEGEYIQVLQRTPDPEACTALSNIYLQKLDMPQALNYARRAFVSHPGTETRLGLVSALLAAGKFGEAQRELNTLLKTARNNAQVQYSAYELEVSLNDNKAALKHLEAAVAMSPGRAPWLIELSDLYKENGDYMYARRALEHALEADPTSLDAFSKLAVIYEFYLHDYDQAISQYHRILSLEPDSVSALAGLDRCQVKKNDIAGALKNQLHSFAIGVKSLFSSPSE